MNFHVIQINLFSIEIDQSSSTNLLNIENNSGLFRGLNSGQIRLNIIDFHAESKYDTITKSISNFISVSKIDHFSIVVKPCNLHNLIISSLYMNWKFIYLIIIIGLFILDPT